MFKSSALLYEYVFSGVLCGFYSVIVAILLFV